MWRTVGLAQRASPVAVRLASLWLVTTWSWFGCGRRGHIPGLLLPEEESPPPTHACGAQELPGACRQLPALRYQAAECQWQRFERARFIELLHGRALWLFGDSLTGQLVNSLRCQLGGSVDKEQRTAEEEAAQGARERQCSPGRCRLHRQEGTGIWLGTCMVRAQRALVEGPAMRQCWEALGRVGAGGDAVADAVAPDVVVANLGAWHNSPSPLKRAVAEWLAMLARMPPEARPLVAWRESTPQHFKGGGSKGGNYAKGNKGCREVPLAEAERHNFRNHATVQQVRHIRTRSGSGSGSITSSYTGSGEGSATSSTKA